MPAPTPLDASFGGQIWAPPRRQPDALSSRVPTGERFKLGATIWGRRPRARHNERPAIL